MRSRSVYSRTSLALLCAFAAKAWGGPCPDYIPERVGGRDENCTHNGAATPGYAPQGWSNDDTSRWLDRHDMAGHFGYPAADGPLSAPNALAQRALTALSGDRPNVAAAQQFAQQALALDPNNKAAQAVMKLTEDHHLAAEPRLQKLRDAAELLRPINDAQQSDASPRLSAGGGGPRLDLFESIGERFAASPAPGSGDPHRIARNLLRQAVMAGAGGKDLAKAVTLAGQALDSNPNYPDALNQRAAFYSMQGRWDKALADTQSSLKILSKNNQPALDLRAFSLAKLGRAEEAAAAAKTALASDPRDAYAYFSLALAEELLGRFEKMLRDLKAAVRINPKLYAEYRAAAEAHGLAVEPLETILRTPGSDPASQPAAAAAGILALLLAAAVGIAWRRWGGELSAELAHSDAAVRRYLWAGALSAAFLAAGAAAFHRRWTAADADVSMWWRAPSQRHKPAALASFPIIPPR
ncbi:MAG: tetratricopeptide repeat protein [Elusimicrobia bacterium]|nr:tetratricopeptide repeat protein [Elusimicrobiota bacterium]